MQLSTNVIYLWGEEIVIFIFPSFLASLWRSTSSERRDAIIWHVRSVTLTSATAAESATDTWGLDWSLEIQTRHICCHGIFLSPPSYWWNLISIPATRFFGDHTSNLSVFGCKYRYLPDKPHLRRFIRGSVCGECVITLHFCWNIQCFSTTLIWMLLKVTGSCTLCLLIILNHCILQNLHI